jgi:5-oxoprolinase (ATP-hydrolysing) subunit A
MLQKKDRGECMKKTALDINCDLGESFGVYRLGQDEEILDLISSANLACGFHAGDPHVMRKTVSLAKRKGVRVGAHPGLPDLIGFGRRAMQVSPSELKDIFTYQIGALKAFVEAAGLKLQHVLQHGILTKMVEEDEGLGRAILESIQEVDPGLFYITLEGTYLPGLAKEMGVKIVRTAFADRAYDRKKRLVSRKIPGSVFHDMKQIDERIEQLVTTGTLTTIEGETLPIEFDSIMLHGDSPRALDMARTVSSALKRLGVQVKPMSELV